MKFKVRKTVKIKANGNKCGRWCAFRVYSGCNEKTELWDCVLFGERLNPATQPFRCKECLAATRGLKASQP